MTEPPESHSSASEKRVEPTLPVAACRAVSPHGPCLSWRIRPLSWSPLRNRTVDLLLTMDICASAGPATRRTGRSYLRFCGLAGLGFPRMVAVVTTGCHHPASLCHSHTSQSRRRRHLLRAPGALPRPRTPPALPRALARRVNAGIGDERTRRKVSGTTKATVLDKLRELHSISTKASSRRPVTRTTRYGRRPGTGWRKGLTAARPRPLRRTRTCLSRS